MIQSEMNEMSGFGLDNYLEYYGLASKLDHDYADI